MRIAIALLLLLASVVAHADNPYGYIFTVSPNPVPPGSAIGVTIETKYIPCLPLPDELATTMHDGGVVYLTVPSSDGCTAVENEIRTYTLDALPPGQYFFRFYSCGGLDAETGEDACLTLEEVPVTVLGMAAQRTKIPTLSAAMLLALGLITVGIGAIKSL